MTKVKEEVKKEVLSNDEVIESLKVQLETYKAMALKAEGAIEILEKINAENTKED
mgnify:CR=1 FL=1|tara:strand:- start:264 stop:428 length:165 start_codon:yes stop_codon:yes gene_type:complete